MIKIGLLGCGNVGQIIAKHLEDIEIVALYDNVYSHAEDLAKLTGGRAFHDFDAFISEDFEIVVEAASVNAVKMYADKILQNGKDLIVLSVGGLADSEFRKRLTETARAKERKVHVPSGAIIGLDNLKIGQISEISRLMLRTTKSPQSLGIESTRKMLIFKGRANDCIKQYPKNINVAVALELATGQEADVELWVDPDVDRNIHEVFVEGEFGEMYLKVRNTPSPENPATSYLAALSILTLLKNLKNPIEIGT
jgi:aspartate dehydrogenase